MSPVIFDQSNGTLIGGPADRYGTADDVADLPVFRGDGQIVSCWKLSLGDRIRVLLSGRVWLRVLAERTHAPVAVDAESPFGGRTGT